MRREIRRYLDDGGAHSAHLLGATRGLGAYAYTLARIGTQLQDPSLLHEAVEATTLVSPEMLAADVWHDVMAGAAGTLVCLLAVGRATGSPEPVKAAVRCGEALLAARAEVVVGTTGKVIG